MPEWKASTEKRGTMVLIVEPKAPFTRRQAINNDGMQLIYG